MAGLTIGEAAVIEGGPAPAITIVTLGALALVMVSGSAVAGLAIIEAAMIKGHT